MGFKDGNYIKHWSFVFPKLILILYISCYLDSIDYVSSILYTSVDFNYKLNKTYYSLYLLKRLNYNGYLYNNIFTLRGFSWRSEWWRNSTRSPAGVAVCTAAEVTSPQCFDRRRAHTGRQARSRTALIWTVRLQLAQREMIYPECPDRVSSVEVYRGVSWRIWCFV